MHNCSYFYAEHGNYYLRKTSVHEIYTVVKIFSQILFIAKLFDNNLMGDFTQISCVKNVV